MTVEEIIEREAVTMSKDCRLVESAILRDLTIVVYDCEPRPPHVGGRLSHERRFAVYLTDADHAAVSGIVKIEWKEVA